MKRQILIILFLSFLIFLGWFSWASQKIGSENFAFIKHQKESPSIFIQPFDLFFQYYDFHVMLYFEGHPEYESVEAMIKEETSFIHVIITRHDQTQIDHINDQKVVEKMQSWRTKREVYYTPIHYKKAQKEGKPYIYLKFNSFKGENVSLEFYGISKPLSKYGGLTDPGRHAESSSLPVMWRKRSTLASPRSRISFDGKSYKIPVKMWIPIFFKGMKGYFTEGFSIGVIRAGEVSLKLVEAPKEIEAGKGWIYQIGNDELIYRIIERNGDRAIIHKMPNTLEKIYTVAANSHLEIVKIEVSPSTTDNGIFTIEFNPPIPNITAISEDKECISSFSISINGNKGLVVGKIKIKRHKDIVLLKLNLDQPHWAAKRQIEVNIKKQDDEFYIKSVIKKEKETVIQRETVMYRVTHKEDMKIVT